MTAPGEPGGGARPPSSERAAGEAARAPAPSEAAASEVVRRPGSSAGASGGASGAAASEAGAGRLETLRPPRPGKPDGVPPASRYARKAPPRDEEDEEAEDEASSGPKDPGVAALDEVCAFHMVALGFAPPVLALLAVTAIIRRGSPAPLLSFLGALVVLTPLVPLLDGLATRREWARRAEVLLALPLALALTIVGLAAVGRSLAVPIALAWVFAAWLVRRLGRADVRAVFARAEPRPRTFEPWSCWGVLVAVLAVTVTLTWVQVDLRRYTTGTLLPGKLGAVATVAGSLAGALVLVVSGWLLRAWRDEGRRDPARTTPAARARILALRAEGRTLRQIAHALDEDGHAPPGGGAWTGRALRGVLRLEPRRLRGA